MNPSPATRRTLGLLLAIAAVIVLAAGALFGWQLRDGPDLEGGASQGWFAAFRFFQFFWLPVFIAAVCGVWSWMLLRR